MQAACAAALLCTGVGWEYKVRRASLLLSRGGGSRVAGSQGRLRRVNQQARHGRAAGMDRLPLLPGFVFTHSTETEHHVPQSLAYKNGYSVPRVCTSGRGQRPLDIHAAALLDLDRWSWEPNLTWGEPRVREPDIPYEPPYAALAGRVLVFRAFCRQPPLPHAALQRERVRHLRLVYHLEDDTISLIEPPVPNSGFVQGRVLRRHRVPRDPTLDGGAQDGERFWHWRHLNVGIPVWLYGVTYRLVGCDRFTREFLVSQGVEVGAEEEAPPDPYTELQQQEHTRGGQHASPTTAAQEDKLGRFLLFDRQVLRFSGVWLEPRDPPEAARKFHVLFYLADGALEVRPEFEPNDGLDHFPKLVGRRPLPRNPLPVGLPSQSSASSEDFYGPQDLRVGETIQVLGRPLLLLDCDGFTRDFYSRNLRAPQPAPVTRPSPAPLAPLPAVPPHTSGLGSAEDSLQSCLHLAPRAPRAAPVLPKDAPPERSLRYSLRLDSQRAADVARQFVLRFSPRRKEGVITELPGGNTGVLAGRFLGPAPLPKPLGPNQGLYEPQDFFIGGVLEVRGQRFVVTGADLYVLRWLEEHRGQFPAHLEDNLRDHFRRQGLLPPPEDPATT